jgi:hypothetical protein
MINKWLIRSIPFNAAACVVWMFLTPDPPTFIHWLLFQTLNIPGQLCVGIAIRYWIYPVTSDDRHD